MGRRRKISVKKRVPKRRPKEKIQSTRKRMLNMGKISAFKFRLRQILEDVEGSEPIFASIQSKSTNIGTEEAKKFIEDKVDQDNLKREIADEIIELIDRYSKLR